MKNISLLLAFTLLISNTFSQITFEKGFFIDNKGKRTECQIKNRDWENNPKKFFYRTAGSDEKKVAQIDSVQAFGIYEYSYFERYTIPVDTSSERLDYMSFDKEPEFENRTTFLKALVTGKASLYKYKHKSTLRFYYSIEGATPEPLIYKPYKTSQSRFKWNTDYKQQLFSMLKCEDIGMKELETVDYREGELVEIFMEYNSCSLSEATNYVQKENRDVFDLNIRLGINATDISINSTAPGFSNQNNFGNQVNFRGGVELELYLPFNKNRWAFLFEADYFTYQAEVPLQATTAQNLGRLDLKYIEVLIGVRYYYALNENQKLFANLSYALYFDRNSSLVFGTQRIGIKNADSWLFGLGYKHNNKYQVEVRYSNVSPFFYLNEVFFQTDYSQLTFTLGYNLF